MGGGNYDMIFFFVITWTFFFFRCCCCCCCWLFWWWKRGSKFGAVENFRQMLRVCRILNKILGVNDVMNSSLGQTKWAGTVSLDIVYLYRLFILERIQFWRNCYRPRMRQSQVVFVSFLKSRGSKMTNQNICVWFVSDLPLWFFTGEKSRRVCRTRICRSRTKTEPILNCKKKI